MNWAADSTRQVCGDGRARRPNAGTRARAARRLAHLQSQQIGGHGGHGSFHGQAIKDARLKDLGADGEQGLLLLVAAAGKAHQGCPRLAGHRERLVGRTPAADRTGIHRGDIYQEGIADRFGIEGGCRKPRRAAAQPLNQVIDQGNRHQGVRRQQELRRSGRRGDFGPEFLAGALYLAVRLAFGAVLNLLDAVAEGIAAALLLAVELWTQDSSSMTPTERSRP